MQIRVLETDAEIESATALMRELRPYIVPGTFLATIRAMQRDGYILAGGFDEAGALVSLAGYRFSSTLFRGPHLFVDDLVTSSTTQKRGYGTAMLAWLARRAIERGMSHVWLDSRITARGFYEQVGFEMMKSIPCRMEAAPLAAKNVSP